MHFSSCRFDRTILHRSICYSILLYQSHHFTDALQQAQNRDNYLCFWLFWQRKHLSNHGSYSALTLSHCEVPAIFLPNPYRSLPCLTQYHLSPLACGWLGWTFPTPRRTGQTMLFHGITMCCFGVWMLACNGKYSTYMLGGSFHLYTEIWRVQSPCFIAGCHWCILLHPVKDMWSSNWENKLEPTEWYSRLDVQWYS